MTISILQYGVTVTLTFGVDTTLSSGVNVPPYSANSTKYTYTATVKEGDADRVFQLGPAGNQATFKLSVDSGGVYSGVIATCTSCPNYGVAQGGSLVMELALGIVQGASGYVMQASTGTSSHFMKGYTDGGSASPFLNEQQTGVWLNTPFTPDADPNSDIDFYIQSNVGDSNITNRFLGAQVTIDTPPPPPAPVLPVTGYLELSYSKDGGHTWSPWRLADLGIEGDFNARALFRRLGVGRRIILRIRCSSDRCRDVIQASVDTTPFA